MPPIQCGHQNGSLNKNEGYVMLAYVDQQYTMRNATLQGLCCMSYNIKLFEAIGDFSEMWLRFCVTYVAGVLLLPGKSCCTDLYSACLAYRSLVQQVHLQQHQTAWLTAQGCWNSQNLPFSSQTIWRDVLAIYTCSCLFQFPISRFP